MSAQQDMTLAAGAGIQTGGNATAPVERPRSPNQRAWARFKRNRLGYYSLWIFAVLLVVATLAEVVSNDRPFIAHVNGKTFYPVIQNPTDAALGGDFLTPADWKDPLIDEVLDKPGNWAIGTVNPHSANSTDYFSKNPSPAAPSADNWLGTDRFGRDIVARLLYGFRVSIWSGIVLTLVGVLFGVVMGAVQGYFGGRIDLTVQRLIEIWGAIPELYLLIIVASIFEPSLLLVLLLLSLWGWIGLSDYVRAEFLRNRSLEFVKAARALGLSNAQIIRRHVLPNSLTPVITFLPFRMSGAIVALTALDFLGLGVPSTVPSLGALLKQGTEALYAWWIIVPTFLLLAATSLLLTFIGESLRDAFDTRKS